MQTNHECQNMKNGQVDMGVDDCDVIACGLAVQNDPLCHGSRFVYSCVTNSVTQSVGRPIINCACAVDECAQTREIMWWDLLNANVYEITELCNHF